MRLNRDTRYSLIQEVEDDDGDDNRDKLIYTRDRGEFLYEIKLVEIQNTS